MKYFKYTYIGLAAVSLLFASCKKEVLNRPPLTSYVDDPNAFWRNEGDLRLFGNGFYSNYFPGYNTSFTADYTPVRGYTFSDDLTSKNVQSSFESSVPSSRGASTEGAAWLGGSNPGPNWNFAWVRKANIFLDRIENVAKPRISDDAYKHWSAVARFFRAYEYSRLVSVFGDVPYYGSVVADNDMDALFKDRDNRGLVMDKVYEDCQYVLANMRNDDGVLFLNKYIAAGFISRFMLFEGTWQHYHGLDAARAKKYLELAVQAAEVVMNSGKYNFSRDFKSLFTSESLAGHPEVLLYRVYDAALSTMHCIGSYSNGTEVVGVDPNLVLIKSFIVNDGNVWQNSSVANAKSFAIADLAKTRDPRFEASFMDVANGSSATLLYGYKFASREAITYIGKTYPAAWGSNTNTSDAPIMRLAEVVLNWIEAKAVLAQYMGGAPVSQADLDKSINAIRKRPLDAAATAKGVKQTAPLMLSAIPDDPARDADVPALIWEIRRERRMEFVFEYSRLLDIKRWKKLNYMNFSNNPDYLLGPWVNLKTDPIGSIYLTTANANAKTVKVKKEDGTVVTYDGTNADAMVGYWMVTGAQNRNAFTDKSYLAPVGQAQIVQYTEKGYKLTQSSGW